MTPLYPDRHVSESYPHGFSYPPERGTEILRVEVGSTLHGTGIPGGEDLDLIGVAVPDLERALYRDARDTWTRRTQPEGQPSGPGDIDLQIHDLAKFVHLAIAGNPSILILLYAPDGYVHYQDHNGRALVEGLRTLVPSKAAGNRYRGYMHGQRQALLGAKAKHGRIRADLVSAHGYDTKYAMHILRLGFQGIEFLTHGRITLPMAGPEADTCRAVRRGDLTLAETLVLVDDAESDLQRAIQDCPFPDRADEHKAAVLVADLALDAWGLRYQT